MTFRKAAQQRWESLFSGQEWALCECGCGRPIHRDQVPHHTKEGQGGQGGKRKHRPEWLRFYADACHARLGHGIRRIE